MPLIAPLLLAGFSAHAADPITPGGVQDTLKQPPALQPAPAGIAAPSAPARPARPEGGRTVTVQRFEITGNTLFSAEQLQAVVQAFANRPVSLAELYEAADALTDHYVSAGYTLASAVVPAQKVNEGTVRIEILEGRVSKLSYEGLKSYRAEELDYYFPRVAGRIYHDEGFEKGLRDVDALPGLDGRAVLRPGADYGTTEIVILAQEKRLEGSVFADNHGRDTVGEYRGGVQLTLNNPGGGGDQLTLLGLNASGGLLQYGALGYSLPTGWRGSRIALNYSYARFELADAFSGVEGFNRNVRGEFQLPVLRDAGRRLDVTAAISETTANTDLLGISLSDTELTLFELGANYSHHWSPAAVSQVTASLGSNFRVSDGRDANAQRLRTELGVQHVQALPAGFQVLANGSFVYSPDPLPDTTAFSIGGPATVRGYAPSEARGDWGYFGSITLRRAFEITQLVVAPRVFADAGTVRAQERVGQPTADALSLSSVGVGLDLAYRTLSFKLDWAQPTDGRNVSDGKDDGRVYGAFSAAF